MVRRNALPLRRRSLAFETLEARDVPSASLLIAEVFTNPSGSDSPYEYVKLVATRDINFATNPHSVVFASLGTATADGWVAGGTRTYGFNLTSGSVTAGTVFAVGGSSLAAPVPKLRTINTATTAGDRFGSASSNGVLGNGGTAADGVAVFNVNLNSVTATTAPIDAIFFGNAIGSAAVSNGGFRLPTNDRYNGGTLTSSSFFAATPGTDQILRATGTYSLTSNSFTTARSWSLVTGHNATSGITLSGTTSPPPAAAGDAYEPNNSRTAAAALGTIQGTRTIQNLSIHNSTDRDWFSFTTTASGTSNDQVRIDFPTAGDLDIRLYDANGTQIGISQGSGPSETISLSGRAAGTYFLEVYGYNGATGAYSATITAPSGGSTVQPPPGGVGDWTIFVYITASDLEKFAHADINEMEVAASQLPSSVKIVVLWDQSSARTTYATGGGTQAKWGGTGRAVITPDTNMNSVKTVFDTSIGEKNTGDPTVLRDFLIWGAATAPANRYSLIMWNHGAGIYGSNYDDSDGTARDNLTLAETVSALSSPGVPRIDTLAYDACLMGMTEAIWAYRGLSTAYASSQEVVDGTGHDYRTLFHILRTNPGSVTAEQLANGYVSSFSAQYVGKGTTADTQSAVRNSGADGLAAAIKNFVSTTALASSADWTGLRAARNGAIAYDDADFKDLASFMRQVANNSSISASIRTAANGVISALNAMLLSKTNDSRASGGLSIYLPNTAPASSYATQFAAFNAATDWNTFLVRMNGSGTSSTGSSGGRRADRVIPVNTFGNGLADALKPATASTAATTATATMTTSMTTTTTANSAATAAATPALANRLAPLLAKLSNLETSKPSATATMPAKSPNFVVSTKQEASELIDSLLGKAL